LRCKCIQNFKTSKYSITKYLLKSLHHK